MLTAAGHEQVDLLPADVFTAADKYYMPYRSKVSTDSSANESIALTWMFLEIDFSNGNITFHRPKLVEASSHTAQMLQKQASDEATENQQVFARLLRTLDAKRVAVGDENCQQFAGQRADQKCWTFDARHSRPSPPHWTPAATAAQSLTWGRCSSVNDFGIAMLFDMELLYASMAVTMWDATDINSSLRPNFSFWLLKGELPMF